MKSVKNFIADVKLSLLFTHVCPATGFCRCYAFQIGKSAAGTVSYGIFSSENSYLLSAICISNSLYGIVTSGNPSAYDAISYGA